jgi:arsenite-transporting ATPase
VIASRPVFLEDQQLRLLLFGGKGGVGKTTCATAAAIQLATRYPQRTFLLASTDPAHSLSDSLAGTALPENLTVREIDFRQSLEQFRAKHVAHFREIARRGTFLDDDDISKFLDLSLPGFDELMAFLNIAAVLREEEYSCMLLDTAPTGHTLRFLELPDLMRVWLGACDAMLAKHRFLAQLYGPSEREDGTEAFLAELRDSINRLAALLTDHGQCRFVPVMLAEAMSVNETERLVARLRSLQISVEDMLVNRLFPSSAECLVCREAHRQQERELARAADLFSGLTMWGIPMYSAEVCGNEALRGFWDGIARIEEWSGPAEAPVALVPLAMRQPALPNGDTRMILFAGKGGVGKTTLACASALRLAETYSQKRVLLFSTDPAHSLADCLDRPVGSQPVPLTDRVFVMEVDAAAEFEALKQRYLTEVEEFFDSLLNSSGMDLEFDHDVVQRILDLAPPGLDEVMALLRAVELLDADEFDLFVLDTAPTGHLIRLLETPELIERWLKAVFGLFLKYRNLIRLPRIVEYLVEMSKRLKVLRSLLCDPRRTQLFAVSILTRMALDETRDLLAACREAHVFVPALFLNLATPASDCPLCRELAVAEARIRRSFADFLADVRQADVFRCGEPRGVDRLSRLGREMYG